jgi:phage shock protein A
MWKRFTRALKALFGGLVSQIEDPRLILEQNMRELNDQIPKMNESIATVKAQVLLMKKEVDRLESLEKEHVAKIRSAINHGRDDIAEKYAMDLEKDRENLIKSREQLAFAEKAYEKALQVKKVFMLEKDRKIKEAREALRAHERAQWQAKIADTLEQFEVGGIDQTHDEMISRINEQTAKNEARMEIALDSIDTKSMEIEVDAEKIRASELVKQFKLEMGTQEAAPATTSKAKKLLDEIDSEETTRKSGAKTLGKERS